MSQFFTINDLNTASGPAPPQFLGNADKTIRMINRVQMELYSRKPGSRKGKITSGYRSPAYNATLPGASTTSQHLTASAVDYKNPDFTPKEVATIADELMQSGQIPMGGIGVYRTHTHIDIRGKKARWNFSPLILAPLASDANWTIYLFLYIVGISVLIYAVKRLKKG